MKIIQSFWTPPFVKSASNLFESRYMGGFQNERNFFFTWALSILRLKEFFPEVHLITDERGKRAWIDFFEFPYDSWSTELECLADIPTDLWAIGKLKTYSLMKEPFVHFDIDFILGDLFDRSVLDSDVIAEFHFSDIHLKRYVQIIKKLYSSEAKMPESVGTAISSLGFVYEDYNMGITGGNDFIFFNNYASEALKFLNNTLPFNQCDDKVLFSFLNCFYEQYLFFNECRVKNKKVTLLIDRTINRDIDYQAKWIESGLSKFNFVHLHGGFKFLHPNISEVWLKKSYPDFYKKLCHKLDSI
jgi:hypothetical protein